MRRRQPLPSPAIPAGRRPRGAAVGRGRRLFGDLLSWTERVGDDEVAEVATDKDEDDNGGEGSVSRPGTSLGGRTGRHSQEVRLPILL